MSLPGAKSVTPARPGETIVLYGTGFGPTNPEIPNGKTGHRARAFEDASSDNKSVVQKAEVRSVSPA